MTPEEIDAMELLYALLIGMSAALGGFLLGSPTEERLGESGRVRPGGNGLLSGRPVQRRGSMGIGIDKARIEASMLQ
jgi:hypothetical protein